MGFFYNVVFVSAVNQLCVYIYPLPLGPWSQPHIPYLYQHGQLSTFYECLCFLLFLLERERQGKREKEREKERERKRERECVCVCVGNRDIWATIFVTGHKEAVIITCKQLANKTQNHCIKDSAFEGVTSCQLMLSEKTLKELIITELLIRAFS